MFLNRIAGRDAAQDRLGPSSGARRRGPMLITHAHRRWHPAQDEFRGLGGRVKCAVELPVVKWIDFNYAGRVYNLAHLHLFTLRYERPSEGSNPAEVYKVDVIFTLHCFSRAPKTWEQYDKNLIYSDGNENRISDFRRYELSKQLPEIIRSLPERKPFHNSDRRNLFTVEVITGDGVMVEYDIFFKVRKISKGRLELIVETAFIRDPSYASTRPKGRPIGFWIILHNTLNNIKIRS
jgi:hypothetical protein